MAIMAVVVNPVGLKVNRLATLDKEGKEET